MNPSSYLFWYTGVSLVEGTIVVRIIARQCGYTSTASPIENLTKEVEIAVVQSVVVTKKDGATVQSHNTD